MLANKVQFEKVLEDVSRESVNNRDFEVNFNKLRMDNEGRIYSIDKSDKEGSELSDFARTQLFTKTDMPVRYMKRLLNENPEMVADQFNYWAEKHDDSKKLFIRGTKDEGKFNVRGVLSDSYTIMDNRDVLESLIDVSDKIPEFNMVKVHKTDKKLHMRLEFPDLYEDFGINVEGKKDIVRVGMDIQNSEIGYSSLIVSPITYRLVCTNGLKMWKQEEGAFKQRHVHLDRSELRDMLKVSMDKAIDKSRDLLDGMRESQKVIIDNPYEYIDKIGKENVLSNKLIERLKETYDVEPESNLYGVVNSFTRTARDMSNYDSRLNLESIASSILGSRSLI